jgi:hypothetical protein
MTKQDSAMEQHTSKPQDNGKTDSRDLVPDWHRGPKPLSNVERLRREYKKYYGFKPCGMTEKELERVVRAKEDEAEARRYTDNSLVSEGRATIGDALNKGR